LTTSGSGNSSSPAATVRGTANPARSAEHGVVRIRDDGANPLACGGECKHVDVSRREHHFILPDLDGAPDRGDERLSVFLGERHRVERGDAARRRGEALGARSADPHTPAVGRQRTRRRQ
jgi:hypothetical protein